MPRYFSCLAKAGVVTNERFDHLNRHCDSGIAIISSVRKRNDSEIVSGLADLRLMISSKVASGHRQATLVRSAL
jgi:hypothetical protein